MKLLRYGESGQERPAALDSNGQIRDLSDIVEDLGHSLTHHAISLGSLRLLQGIYERRRATLH